MLADTLKTYTLTNHQQLEKLLIFKMKSIRSVQGYISLLQLFYGYFGGLEQKIQPFINDAIVPDYTLRRKAEAIADDIRNLGGTPIEYAGNNSLPDLHNTLQALGALYVIEGSTLGGKIISQMMAKQLDIIDGKGLSFFSGYGDDTEVMWERFREILNTCTNGIEDEQQVLSAADETFVKFKLWIDNNG